MPAACVAASQASLIYSAIMNGRERYCGGIQVLVLFHHRRTQRNAGVATGEPKSVVKAYEVHLGGMWPPANEVHRLLSPHSCSVISEASRGRRLTGVVVCRQP